MMLFFIVFLVLCVIVCVVMCVVLMCVCVKILKFVFVGDCCLCCDVVCFVSVVGGVEGVDLYVVFGVKLDVDVLVVKKVYNSK